MIRKPFSIDGCRTIASLGMALLLTLAGCSSALHRTPGGSSGSSPEVSPGVQGEAATTEGAAGGFAGRDDRAEIYEETGTPPEEGEDVSFLSELKEQEFGEAIFKAMPEESNARVDYFLRYFQGPKREWFTRALTRSGRYLTQMQQILREEGLPEDLVYLAMIESGYNPYAYSRAHAAGAWQFIEATGRRYGLVIDGWVDERRDLEKSTRAAARYLRDLYAMFNDWCIAAASYNAGERKLERAIAMYRSKCFWHISKQRYLRDETKNYVPMFLAAMTIANDPETYGFGHVVPESPLLYETVRIPHSMDLSVIARGCGQDLALLKSLNPQLRYGCTPPYYRGGDYEVKVPQGTRESFLAYYDQLGPEKRLAFRHHRVRKGDTIHQVARRYGIATSALREVNHLGKRTRLRAGENLTIPVSTAGVAAAEFPEAVRTASAPEQPERRAAEVSSPAQRKLIYVVRKGDTLSRISRRYEVSLDTLVKWNGLKKSSVLSAGRNLVVFQPAAASPAGTMISKARTPENKNARVQPDAAPNSVHVVRRGDTLFNLSCKYGVELSSLLACNGLKKSSTLRVGQKLLLQPQAPAAAPAGYVEMTAAEEASAVTPQEIWHTVRSGDTLFEIAQKYRVTVAQISNWNKLGRRHLIHPGMRIKILAAARLEANANDPFTGFRAD